MSRDLQADRDRGDTAVPETAPVSLEAAPAPRAHHWRSVMVVAALALGVLVGPLALAVGIHATARAGDPSSAEVVNAEELEAAYGIRISLVAVIASGGVINVRFTVVDVAKAQHLLHEDLPELYVESKGAVLRASLPKAHKMAVLAGASYFLLYPNSGGVVQAGTPVSVVVDQLRLEPLSAQS